MKKDEYGFRKLIETTNKNCRDELDEYYIISKSRMDNIIHCLESGAKEIDNLKEELFKEKIWRKESDREWYDKVIALDNELAEERKKTNPANKQIYSLEAQIEVLRDTLSSLLTYAEINTCLHEETYRGGTIWEICSMCGKKWADDEGGKPEDAHEFPKAIANAQNILTNLPKKSEEIKILMDQN